MPIKSPSKSLSKSVSGSVVFAPRGYALIQPSSFHPLSHLVLAFVGAHALFGRIRSQVFQLAHTVERTTFPLPGDGGNSMQAEWAIHQKKTTADFALQNRLAAFYMGGLNYQVEHHLFHRVSRVHYRALSAIARRACEQFTVRYLGVPSERADLPV